ncbi:MAG: helix-turn-helix transcriptional regulator [Candidatus Aminicenantes bacterium]|nr:helix-turn-helix transcriptional regulator [Candidatus Aminicenantes bacterium]
MIKFKDYLDKRLKDDPDLALGFWDGYEDFKIGVMLKEARENSGLTQEQIAQRIKTTKSVISRIENHAKDIRLSTLKKFANALGKKLTVLIE